MTRADVDAIAATAGPGLIGGGMVGLVTGKALAHAANKPLIAVNHLEGHALSPRLTDASLAFPYLLLLVSGGHCQLLLVKGVRSEEHTSELQSLMRISYAVFCLKKKINIRDTHYIRIIHTTNNTIEIIDC